ncbi:hypothetical protein ASF12_28160 [Paenibacillus sp. Leaf72]|nr:hypothetical protein ASF12_28160 [Paenibacillus sp. Leaf72]
MQEMKNTAEQLMNWQAELDLHQYEQVQSGTVKHQADEQQHPALEEMNENLHVACIEPNIRCFCVSQPDCSILNKGGEAAA